MEHTTQSIRVIAGAAALALLVVPVAGHAAGYLKIPSIPGESETKKDSGEAHLDYLTIKMERVMVTRKGEDHSSGDEHEIEYDVAAGSLMQTARPKIAGVTWGAVKPARMATRDAATGLPTGKRQHKPLSTTKPIDKATPMMMRAAVRWSGCAVGRRYDHVLLGDGAGKEHRLEGVRVAHCGREYVSFTYDKIS